MTIYNKPLPTAIFEPVSPAWSPCCGYATCSGGVVQVSGHRAWYRGLFKYSATVTILIYAYIIEIQYDVRLFRLKFV